MDKLVLCILQTFLVHQELLIELLTGTESAELDIDILIRHKA